MLTVLCLAYLSGVKIRILVYYIRYTKQCCGSGSGIRCLFYPWVRDPGWVKNQDSDQESGSGRKNPGHISESLQTIFLG
jgi:hypothetical protein